MAFCQAAIDDSGNEPNQQIFVLAGFVAPAENWIAFTLGWDRALKEAPIPLDYFKFTEAMRLRGQFDKDRGWTEPMRDDQLRTFSEIIQKHASARFSAAVRHEHYQRYIRDAAPARVRTLLTDTPYQLLAARAVVAACTAIMATNAGDECAFYFDTQPGQDVILQALWPRLVASIQEGQGNLPPGFTLPRIVGDPRFESELDWSPLQASDLLAGAMRTELMTGAYPAALSALEGIPGNPFNMEEEHLKEMGDGLERMMEEFQRENPNLPLFHYDAKTARRMRKKAMRGMLPKKPRDA